MKLIKLGFLVLIICNSLNAQQFFEKKILFDNLNVELGSNDLIDIENVVYSFKSENATKIVTHFDRELNLYNYENDILTNEGSIGELSGFIAGIYDHNIDGNIDILGHFRIKYNNGDFSFQEETLPVSSPINGRIYRPVDFNTDGIVDIMTRELVFFGGSFTETIYIYILDSSQNIQETISFFSNEELLGAQIYDINADGFNDVVYTLDIFGDNRIVIQMNNGNNTFTEQNIGVSNTDFLIESIDVENDGDLDLLITGFNGKDIEILENNDGIFSEDIQIIDSDRVYTILVDDFDNDQDSDIIYFARDTQDSLDIKIAINENQEFSQILKIGSVPFSGVNINNSFEQAAENWIHLNDYDNDGDNDIMVNSIQNKQFFVLENRFNDTVVDIDEDQDGFTLADDCDDNNPNINPSVEEIVYNGLDDDCNDLTLDDDLDQDGFNLADDCDDNNPNINPSVEEIVYNGLDDDCNDLTLDDDLDQDGFNLADDCDDNNPNINPDGIEVPNNEIDEDCDGMDLITSVYDAYKGDLLEMYPNPSTGLIFLKYPQNFISQFHIYSIQGQHILKVEAVKDIDLSFLNNGIYMLKSDTREGNVYKWKKIVINK